MSNDKPVINPTNNPQTLNRRKLLPVLGGVAAGLALGGGAGVTAILTNQGGSTTRDVAQAGTNPTATPTHPPTSTPTPSPSPTATHTPRPQPTQNPAVAPNPPQTVKYLNKDEVLLVPDQSDAIKALFAEADTAMTQIGDTDGTELATGSRPNEKVQLKIFADYADMHHTRGASRLQEYSLLDKINAGIQPDESQLVGAGSKIGSARIRMIDYPGIGLLKEYIEEINNSAYNIHLVEELELDKSDLVLVQADIQQIQLDSGVGRPGESGPYRGSVLPLIAEGLLDSGTRSGAAVMINYNADPDFPYGNPTQAIREIVAALTGIPHDLQDLDGSKHIATVNEFIAKTRRQQVGTGKYTGGFGQNGTEAKPEVGRG